MDSIPDHPNKNKNNGVPFDPIKYFNNHVLNFEKEWKTKYSENYYDSQLKIFSQNLEYTINIYHKWFNKFIEQLKEDLSNNKYFSEIHVPEYGNEFNSFETDMKDKAYTNFCYLLLNKGYPYKETTEEWDYVDVMDGRCRACKKIMKISLK